MAIQQPRQSSRSVVQAVVCLRCSHLQQSRKQANNPALVGTPHPALRLFLQAASDYFAVEDSSTHKSGKGGAQCRLPPLKVMLVDDALNCTIQQLWDIICKPDPHFQRTIHRLSNNREIQYGQWHEEGARSLAFVGSCTKVMSMALRNMFCIV